MSKLAKGKLVQLNNAKCFTVCNGGALEWPLINYLNDERGTVESFRPTTHGEQQAWYQTDASKGMNDAGESKLPPQATMVLLHKYRIYEVLRARCRVRLGWGNPTPGLTKVLCTHTGEETYVSRHLLEVLE